MFLRFSFFIFMTGFSLAASAYSPKTHGKLTRLGVELLHSCQTALKLSEEEIQFLDDSNQYEDLMFLPRRLSIWHFYDRSRAGQNGSLGQDLTMHDRFSKLSKRLANPEIAREDKNHLIGNLMHFVQDVTVPAHVIPVFHGAPFIYGGHLKDSIDSYPVNSDALKKSFPELCSRLQSLKGLSTNQILDATAADTYVALVDNFSANINGAPQNINWASIWAKENPGDQFGSYTCVSLNLDKDTFNCEESGEKVALDRNQIDAFIQARHQAALIGSAALILNFFEKE